MNSIQIAFEYISRFSIGTVEAIDANGPRINVTNVDTPQSGTLLSVDWQWAGSILGIIPFVHLLLLLITTWILDYWRVIVRDDSPFATALLLRRELIRIEKGTMLNGDEIRRGIDHDLTYSWEMEGFKEEDDGESDVKYLCVGGPGNLRLRRRFGDGTYD